jgi:phage baseplate assembly protein W
MSGLSYTLPATTPATSPVPVDAGTKDVFGYDIFFQGMLQLTPGGDYKRIGGAENVKAAIYRRLLTRPGDYRFRPDYGVGLQDFVKKAPTTALLDQLRQRVIDNLSLDIRLSQIDVTVESDAINDVPVLRVLVRAVVGGGLVRFEPFVFRRSAA